MPGPGEAPGGGHCPFLASVGKAAGGGTFMEAHAGTWVASLVAMPASKKGVHLGVRNGDPALALQGSACRYVIGGVIAGATTDTGDLARPMPAVDDAAANTEAPATAAAAAAAAAASGGGEGERGR